MYIGNASKTTPASGHHPSKTNQTGNTDDRLGQHTCPPRIMHVPECREKASGAATATNLSSLGTTSNCFARWSLMWCRATCEPFRFSYSATGQRWHAKKRWTQVRTRVKAAYICCAPSAEPRISPLSLPNKSSAYRRKWRKDVF